MTQWILLVWTGIKISNSFHNVFCGPFAHRIGRIQNYKTHTVCQSIRFQKHKNWNYTRIKRNLMKISIQLHEKKYGISLLFIYGDAQIFCCFVCIFFAPTTLRSESRLICVLFSTALKWCIAKWSNNCFQLCSWLYVFLFGIFGSFYHSKLVWINGKTGLFTVHWHKNHQFINIGQYPSKNEEFRATHTTQTHNTTQRQHKLNAVLCRLNYIWIAESLFKHESVSSSFIAIFHNRVSDK